MEEQANLTVTNKLVNSFSLQFTHFEIVKAFGVATIWLFEQIVTYLVADTHQLSVWH